MTNCGFTFELLNGGRKSKGNDGKKEGTNQVRGRDRRRCNWRANGHVDTSTGRHLGGALARGHGLSATWNACLPSA
jgi:hypothetical protein